MTQTAKTVSLYGEVIGRLDGASGGFPLDDAEALARILADAMGSRADYFSTVRRALMGSLDAALALVEEKLPGWSYIVRKSGFGTPSSAELYNPMRSPGAGSFRAEVNSTAPIAVLIALLRSLEGE